MKPLRRLMKAVFRSPSSFRRGAGKPRNSLRFETLEDRRVYAVMAVLDFDGETVTDAQLAQGGWGELGATSIPSFHSLFNNTRPFLDLNSDGSVNNTDATQAINRIVALVNAQYAPYDIGIVVGDQDAFQGILTDSRAGDVIVLISGERDTIADDFETPDDPMWGWAPTDGGNQFDDFAWIFTKGMADDQGYNADQFINAVAYTISHEMGHSFGLEHISANPTDQVRAHHLMGDPFEDANGNTIDGRDFGHYFNFPDRYFPTEDGGLPQNPHQYLTQTLGASPDPWVATLQPGVLTIQGNDSANDITVRGTGAPNGLLVIIDGVQTALNWFAPSITSINPYVATALASIQILAEGGNDEIDVWAVSATVMQNVFIPVHAFGGEGDDTIYGGAAGDHLCGEQGKDTLIGRGGHDFIHGGSNDDVLSGGAGNDVVYGASGNDELKGGSGYDDLYGEDGDDELWGGSEGDDLFGGDGADYLFGEDGNDLLDGGDDSWNARDYLFGGAGYNTFVQHAGWAWWIYDEDMLMDKKVGDTVRYV